MNPTVEFSYDKSEYNIFEQPCCWYLMVMMMTPLSYQPRCHCVVDSDANEIVSTSHVIPLLMSNV